MLKEATRCLARSCGPLDLQTSVETIKKDKKKKKKNHFKTSRRNTKRGELWWVAPENTYSITHYQRPERVSPKTWKEANRTVSNGVSHRPLRRDLRDRSLRRGDRRIFYWCRRHLTDRQKSSIEWLQNLIRTAAGLDLETSSPPIIIIIIIILSICDRDRERGSSALCLWQLKLILRVSMCVCVLCAKLLG